MSMNPRTSLPGSGARRVSSVRTCRWTLCSCRTFPGERAQERPQRGRRPGCRQSPAWRRGAAGPRHRCCPPRRSSLLPGTGPSVGRSSARVNDPDMRTTRSFRAAQFAPGPSRGPGPPSTRDAVIKRRVDPRELMQQSHVRGVLANSTTVASATPIVPSSGGTFRVDAPEWTPIYSVNSRLSVDTFVLPLLDMFSMRSFQS